jgi:hypothetical protein
MNAPISPEMMNMVGGQQGGQPPVSSPMSTPQPNEGEKQGAMAQIQMVTKILEQTLAAFGSTSEEGRAVLHALTILGKKFGREEGRGKDLIPSEIMNMVGSMPKSDQAQMQPPGAPPGGAGMPPGAPPMQ